MLLDSEVRVSSLKRSLLGLEHDHRQVALDLAQGTCSTTLIAFIMAWFYLASNALGSKATIVIAAVSSSGTETIITAFTEPLKQMCPLFVCVEPSSAVWSQTPP